MQKVTKKFELAYTYEVPEEEVMRSVKEALEANDHTVVSLKVLYLGKLSPRGNPSSTPRWTYQINAEIIPLDRTVR